MANICKNLERDLKALNITYAVSNEFCHDFTKENENDANEIIVYDQSEGFFNMNSYKMPLKKEINFNWIINKINTKKTFVNFTENFKELLKKHDLYHSLNVYPTSYGVGVFVVFSYRNENANYKTQISNLLTKYKIDYRTETSEAGWVYRFVISKKAENINKLKSI